MTCLKLLVRRGWDVVHFEPKVEVFIDPYGGPYVRPICNNGCPLSFKRILFQLALNVRVPELSRKELYRLK